MATAPSQQAGMRTTNVDVLLAPGGRPVRVTVPASTREEALAILRSVGNGGAGAFAYGSVLTPLREAYKRDLARVDFELAKRYQALGPKPTTAQLEELARWGNGQRTRIARVMRIPTPVTMLGLEARDWHKYGPGGRNFSNLMRRNANAGRFGDDAYRYMLQSATRSNPTYDANVARGARVLRGGGGVIAVVGLGATAHDIWQAPAAQRPAMVQRSAVGMAGGYVGAELGMLGAGALAAVFFASPPGWVVIAIGAVGVAGGVAGGMIADRLFYPDNHQRVTQTFASGAVLQCTPSNPLGSPLTARARR